MTTQQLEIGLACSRINPRRQRRLLRAARARWWFGRMRQAVNTADTWTPPSPMPTDLFSGPVEK